MNVVVKDAETGNRITMEVDEENTIEEIIEEVANYWKKDPGAYVIRYGKRILQGGSSVKEANLQDNDVIELIPDPEGGACFQKICF